MKFFVVGSRVCIDRERLDDISEKVLLVDSRKLDMSEVLWDKEIEGMAGSL